MRDRDRPDCAGAAAVAVGLAQAAFEAALRYSQQRTTFGKPICQHQAVQLKLADMATAHHRGAPARPVARPSAWTPTRATTRAPRWRGSRPRRDRLQVTLEAMRIHGGYGYTSEFPVERFYRDAAALLVGAARPGRRAAPVAARRLDGAVSYGRYYEEFTVGQEFNHWPGRTITEADCTWFALLTMNQHPLHSDAHYAETHTQHKQRVVLGPLVYSVVIGMTVADISGRAIANLEVERAQAREADLHRRHALRAEPRARAAGVAPGRPRHRDRGDAGHQPARRDRVLLYPRRARAQEEPRHPRRGPAPLLT